MPKTLPPSPVMCAADAWDYLGGRYFVERFEKAGLLKPCARTKPKGTKGRHAVLYKTKDILWAAEELAAGRIPQPTKPTACH